MFPTTTMLNLTSMVKVKDAVSSMKNVVAPSPCSMNSALVVVEDVPQLVEVVENAPATLKLMDADMSILTLIMIVTTPMLKIMQDSEIMKLMAEVLMLSASLVTSILEEPVVAKLPSVLSIPALVLGKLLNSKFNSETNRLFAQKKDNKQ